MREYELIYVIQPDASPEREKEINSRLDDAIARSGGTVLLRDDWGKRKLAYDIKRFQKGHYVLLSFLGRGPIVAELERGLRIDADILRYLSVRVQDEVKDVEARIASAREEAAEQARRREERDRLEAERTARLAAAAAEANEREAKAAEAKAAEAGAAEAGATEGPPADEEDSNKPDAGAESPDPESE
ncbi:MAG: 30S ribosomal protein S6 [Myxococcota bacterium]